MRNSSVLSLALVAALLVPCAATSQWVQTNGPYGGFVLCLAVSPDGAGGTNLFAGISGGGVFLSTNNGANWTAVNAGLTVDSFGRYPLVYALAVSPDGAGPQGASGTNLFAGTSSGGVFLSTNNGTSWTAVNAGLTDTDVMALTVSPNGTGGTNLFAGTFHGGVFLSTNNGTNWTAVNTGLANTDVRALVVSPNGTGPQGASGTNLFAGTGGGVFLSTNNGTSWTAVNTGLTNNSVQALAVSPNGTGGTNLFAGTGGGVFLSANGGTSWTAVSAGLPVFPSGHILALAVSPNGMGGTNLFAGSAVGGVFLSTNSGTNWTAVNTGLTNTGVKALAVSANGTGGTNLFAGTDGGVFLSTNNATDWIAINTGLAYTPVQALAVSPDGTGPNGGSGATIFAGTLTGGVFFSSNSGTSWTAINTGLTTGWVTALVFSPNGTGGTNIFAGTDDAGVFLSTNSGTSWTAVNTGLTNPYVQALAVSPNGTSGTNLFVGTRGGVFLSTNNGSDWTAALTRDAASLAVIPDGAGGTKLFAGGNGVFLSTNNGTDWTRVNTGLPDETGHGSYPRVSALAVSPNGANGMNLFAGTDRGIFLSTNNGTNWTAVNAGLTGGTVQALAVSGTNLFAGTRGGGVFRSTDNGTSWTAVNTGLTNTVVDALAVSGTNLFAGTFGSGVWRRPLSEMVGPQAPNLVQNPGFESGTDPWQFYTNGSGDFTNDAPGDGSPHAAFIEIATAGTNVQLYQHDISLTAGTRYRLSFKAYSSSGHDLFVSIHKHGAPYTGYGLEEWAVDLAPFWKTFTTEFTAENFAGSVQDARLRFWLAPYAQVGDRYYIDDVVLEETTPNLVINGGFERGTDHWVFWANGAGEDITGDGHAAHIMMESPGTNVQLYQSNLHLESGARYELQFQAYSNTGHDVGVYVHEHDAPYTNYGLDWEEVDLGTSSQTYTMQFTAENFTGAVTDARLRFWLSPFAEAGDEYYVDDVVLTRIDGGIAAKRMPGSETAEVNMPKDYALCQNYPNPFNPTTEIQYTIPAGTRHAVSLRVYDVLGREVATLVNEEKPAGRYTVQWDASRLASGVYLCKMEAGGFVDIRKLVVLR